MADVPEEVQAGPTGFTMELSDANSDQPTNQISSSQAVLVEEAGKEKLWKPVVCTFAICLGSIIMGATVVYPSPAIPNLNSNPNPFHVDSDQNAWIGSVVTLGALVGGLVGGPLMDRLGRKMALMACAGPFVAAWVIIIAASNVPCMLAGRVLTGIGTGVYSVICPNYVSEIAPVSIRGLLGSCHQLFVCIGVLYVFVLGAFLSWRWLAFACSALNLVLVVALCFIPETPRWLLSQGRREDAEFALKWLRGHEDLSRELTDLQAGIQESKTKASPREFLQPQLLRPLLVSLGLMVFQQFSGINVIMVYTVQIFQMSKSTLDPNVQTILVGVVGIVGTLVSVFVSDCAGRKALLMVSGLVMALTMSGMGTYFYLLEADNELATGTLSWLPLACLVVFNFGFNVAFGPIPWLIMSELFTLRAKGVATALSTAFNWLLAFAMTKFFSNVTDAIQLFGGFWICAGFCALSLPFIIFCVPETKGKSLEEVQKHFM